MWVLAVIEWISTHISTEPSIHKVIRQDEMTARGVQQPLMVVVAYYSVENEGRWGENGVGRCRRVVAKLATGEGNGRRRKTCFCMASPQDCSVWRKRRPRHLTALTLTIEVVCDKICSRLPHHPHDCTKRTRSRQYRNLDTIWLCITLLLLRGQELRPRVVLAGAVSTSRSIREH